MDPSQLSSATRLNEQEMWRDLVRRSEGTVVDTEGLLLISGSVPSLQVAMRTQARLPADEALRMAAEFFAKRGSRFILVAAEPQDADLAAAALETGFEAQWREVGMLVRERVEAPESVADVEIRRVDHAAGVADFGRVVAEANDEPESERARVVFSRPESILAPHIAAFVACVEGEPVSSAMTLVSHGVAGIFWVATVERARRRGLGGAMTRVATNAGFDLGAKAAWLGASEMGAGLYRSLGFEEFGPRYQEYVAPEFA